MNGYFFNGLHNFTWFYPIFFSLTFSGNFSFCDFMCKEFSTTVFNNRTKMQLPIQIEWHKNFFCGRLIFLHVSPNLGVVKRFYKCRRNFNLFRMPEKFESFSNAAKIWNFFECHKNLNLSQMPEKFDSNAAEIERT